MKPLLAPCVSWQRPSRRVEETELISPNSEDAQEGVYPQGEYREDEEQEVSSLTEAFEEEDLPQV